MFTESETAPSQHTCRPVCLLKVLSFFFFKFYFQTLHNCISFAKYQNESATGIHSFILKFSYEDLI